ncbi:MAG: hypothetical protein ACHQZR_00850 [Candidatus Limnocylindrales bacterium]
MQTVTVVLSVRTQHVDAFEAGFRDHELPVWRDLVSRGVMLRASLTRLAISTSPVEGAVQYLIAVDFATAEGHHEHDHHPGFEAWNRLADGYQVAEALAYGGDTILYLDETARAM